jgi:Bacterial aa3 type cytochrome c oxidase subunit IV
MAEHGEVQYATGAGDDYPQHETTYRGFVKLIEVAVVTLVVVLISLDLIGVKAAVTLGVILLIAVHIAALVGLLTRLSWRAPAVVLVLAVIALAVT